MKRRMQVRITLAASAVILASFFCGCSGSGAPDADTDIDVVFESAVQTGGVSGTTDSAGLILTFDVDPASLTADDVSVAGATKGALTGSGTTRSLAISDIAVEDGETVSVAIASPSGYAMLGSPKAATVYRAPHIGMAFQGGIIAYIARPGDPIYVSGQTHGLIASIADLSTGIRWNNGSDSVTGATGTALCLGALNTAIIVDIQGAGSYAARLCDDYANADAGTGVYSDWYLPSIDELRILYQNREAIGGFSIEAFYWSSTEYAIGHAWLCYFRGGDGYGGKSNENFVRAVRIF